jgi:GNAT superfamily N-acetyltransferase/predicted nucleic acid-binding protein
MNTFIDVFFLCDRLEFVDMAIDLMDRNSKTLGFFPAQAFREKVDLKHVIGVSCKGQFGGYILFSRRKYGHVVIIQLCVHESFRGKGLASTLLGRLKDECKYDDLIRLSCRSDFKENNVWEKFGFTYRGERLGRMKTGSWLSDWIYVLNNNPILSIIEDEKRKERDSVAVDANVFYALFDSDDNRHHDIKGLLADWICSEINIYVTSEIYNDIQNQKNVEKRGTWMCKADEYVWEQEEFNDELYDLIKSKFKSFIKENDLTDLRHLVRAIEGQFEYFLTFDDKILKIQKELYDEYGLYVCTPPEYICKFDEMMRSEVYEPQRSAESSSYRFHPVVSEKVKGVVKIFQGYPEGEKKYYFQKKINGLIESPYDSFLIEMQSSAGKSIGLYGFKISGKIMDVEIVRTTEKGIKRRSILDYLFLCLVKQACHHDCQLIRINETLDNENLLRVSKSNQYIHVEGVPYKVVANRIFETFSDCSRFIVDLPIDGILKKKVHRTLSDLIEPAEKTRKMTLDLEHYLFPCIILDSDSDVPTYLVPIKPHWAWPLFDYEGASGDLWGSDAELALTIENVYYSAASLPPENFSYGRILWYYSEDKQSQKSQSVCAVSRLLDVTVGKPQALYNAFRRYGAYERKDVVDLVKPGRMGRALRFDCSLIFKKPIALSELRCIFEELGESIQLVSPKLVGKKASSRLISEGFGDGKLIT